LRALVDEKLLVAPSCAYLAFVVEFCLREMRSSISHDWSLTKARYRIIKIAPFCASVVSMRQHLAFGSGFRKY